MFEFHLHIFEWGTLNQFGAKCYVLRNHYFGLIKHNNKDLGIHCSSCLGKRSEFINIIEEFHSGGLLVFKDVGRIPEFVDSCTDAYINLSRDFGEWGEFHFEKIIGFCRLHQILPSDCFFDRYAFPEMILDLSECLESDACSFEVDSDFRVFKNTCSQTQELYSKIYHMASCFYLRERALVALEILKSDMLMDRFKAYLTKLSTATFTLTDGGITDEDELLDHLDNLLVLIPRILLTDLRLDLKDLDEQTELKTCKIRRDFLLEVFNDGYLSPLEIDFTDEPPLLSEGLSKFKNRIYLRKLPSIRLTKIEESLMTIYIGLHLKVGF